MRILTQIARAASVVALLVAGDAWLAPSPADAQDAQTSQATPASVWAIARGGQLYDKWWAVTEADRPEGTHPSYPADGQQSGPDTWRCKECHGWDYKGVDGAYGKGPHYTGIKGVRGVVGADIESIVDIIRDDTHRYTESMITASAAKKLALFLSAGQVDMDRYIDLHSTVSRYIDRATKMARGEVLRGAQFYRAICATCHGLNGKAINVGGDHDNPVYVGTVAVDDPWAVLHKIRFGQPGVGMVSLSVLPIQDEIDILAYVQTLPLR